VFKSKGLPESLPQALFCLWLKKSGILDKVKKQVEAGGKDFFKELNDLYVSPVIAKALLAVDANLRRMRRMRRRHCARNFPGASGDG